MMSNAEKTALEKKFDQAVQPAMYRSRGSRRTTWRPSATSVRIDRRWAGSGGGSRFRIAINVAAEKKNDAASKTIAMGALKSSMTAPATAGPPVLSTEMLGSQLLFPSTRCLGATR